MPNSRFSFPLLVVAAVLGAAGGVAADELTDLLRGGPVVRVEQSEAGKFKRVLAIADVEAPLAQVWEVLNSQEKFSQFMPRVKRISVRQEGPMAKAVSYVLDTPFMDTSYTLRWSPREADHTIKVEHVSGDIKGSEYEYKLVSVSPERTRVYYGGVTRNFSSMASRFEDDQQTITVGVNVTSMLAGLKAIKLRSETLWKQKKATLPAAAPTPAPAAPAAVAPAPVENPPATTPAAGSTP
ncbi:MAG: SRPBCC family protein [Myxococcota bacterium]